MNRVMINEAYSELKKWFKSKFIHTSITLKPLLTIISRSKPQISSNHHLTPSKIIKWLIGSIPVTYISYNLALYLSNKTQIDDIITYFKSEDQIFKFLSQSKPVVTFLYLPGDVYSEVTHPGFHKIAEEYREKIEFVKVNCSRNSSYCRSRKMKHFPTVEIFFPPPADDASFEMKTRYRLLKASGDYAVSPFKSDLSYEGFKAALQELKLIPSDDPFAQAKDYYQQQFENFYK